MDCLRPTLEFRRGEELVTHAVASPDLIWFQGHFPSIALLPGVAILALVEESLVRFWGLEGEPVAGILEFQHVRFRRLVKPGDNLRVRVRRTGPRHFSFSVEVDAFHACTGTCQTADGTFIRLEGSVPSRRIPLALATKNPAALFSNDGTTVAELARQAAGFSSLKTLDGSQVRICVASEDRVVVASAMLAALMGGIQVVFPPAITAPALLATFDVQPFSHWIGPSEWRLSLAGIKAEAIDIAALASDGGSLHTVAGDEARVFLMTGGTTGQPRSWAKTPRNLLSEVVFHLNALHVRPGDHILATVPPLHIYGLLFSVLLPLYSGATVERISPFFPKEIADRIARATILVSTPAHLHAMAAAPPGRHSLRLVLCSGAPLSAEDAAAFFARTGLWPLEIYGSTETGGVAVRRQDVAECAWSPLLGVDCRMDGENLAVRSAFVSDEAPRDGEQFFTTADLALLHPEGRFDLLGRADGVVKVGGERVLLPAIERVLISLQGVDDAVVLALPSPSGRGQEIVALVISDRPADEILPEARERLPSPSWPRRLRCVNAIPTTASGKRDRAAILQALETETCKPVSG
jgi:acyl-CoA synthetase (AMP-forming)/AMP-acid ligase II/3-hydroxymyristoyl/3-hydroxydecanoyl-(acyl carrier protein) dehydratase